MDALRKFNRYVDDVLEDRCVVGLWAHRAVQRHVDDMACGGDRGLVWSPELAASGIDWFGLLTHSKGEWAGQPFIIEPWQAFIVGSLFGWYAHRDGRLVRRFNVAYDEIARKNGKSTLAAGVGLKLGFGDGEAGAEVYSAATKKDQARIVHEEAIRMVRKSPSLSRRIAIQKDTLYDPRTYSKYVPLGQDNDSTDGLNVAGAIVDELHQHKTPGLWNAINNGMGARRNPLLFAITTAGASSQTETICLTKHHYSKSILDPANPVVDDTTFAMIFSLDDGDLWTDESVWPKANPNYGVSVFLADMRRTCREAQSSLLLQHDFRRKRCNEWVGAPKAWLPDGLWEGCERNFSLADVRGMPCWLGLDLASVNDLTAMVALFRGEGRYFVWPWFWAPRERAEQREHDDKVPYLTWGENGLIRLTPTASTDYSSIRRLLNELRDEAHLDIREILYDPFNATHLVNELGEEDGFPMTEFRQTYRMMSAPLKELERLMREEAIVHDGHAVLRWCMRNASLKVNEDDYWKLDKKTSGDKIDGAVALAMALGGAMRGDDHRSVYDTGGVVTL